MKKIYLYPAWIRLWHWTNAALALLLIVSGVSIYYKDAFKFLMPFSLAVPVHNIAGVMMAAMYLFYIIISVINGNWRQYALNLKTFAADARKLLRYYFFGIFYKEKYPFVITSGNRFDALKKLFYIFIMFVFIPLILVSGFLLLFSHKLPLNIFGLGSIWLMDVIHIVAGYILSVMIFAHIYFAATASSAFSLTKAMITGWFAAVDQPALSRAEALAGTAGLLKRADGRIFPSSFYNPFTLTGVLIAIISFCTILFLVAIETLSTIHNSYLGIITFLILPGILVMGLVLMAFGVFREFKRLALNESGGKSLPVIDLNNPRQRTAMVVFITGSFVLALFSAYGSYKAYEYTESDEFCGTVCHSVMHPEYITYKRSPHSRVGCVQCHIGSGAGWFVKSKLSGLYQVYAVLTDSYPRPIPTPVANLRPAQETCEQCHWPRFFYNEKKIVRDYYLSDEVNTRFNIEMSVKVGGGNSETGNTSGIHWHMNLANDIQYIHTDRKRNDIPWVKSTSRLTGKVTVYSVPDFKPDMNAAKRSGNLRTMDCIDCHSRPSHTINPAERVVNQFMSLGRIDTRIPFIKQVSVQALESHIESTDKAESGISNFVWNYYSYKPVNMDEGMKSGIKRAIKELADIYKHNYFPEMNVSWREYQNNIGHLHSPGCFRCHDGNHMSPEGKVLTNDCNTCHTFKTELVPSGAGQNRTVINEFVHPGGDNEKIKGINCVVCHGVKNMSKIRLGKLNNGQ